MNRPDFGELLESRLSALNAVPFKRAVVETKLNELRATVTTRSFRNHLFEAGVLGDFAVKNILKDIEDDTTGVDAVVDLAGRDVLVEATNTAQEFNNDFDVAFVSIDREVEQVVRKVGKKVLSGRQIAKACGKPALLFLALTRRGADPLSARGAIERCLDDPACAVLSGVVVAPSWAFLSTSWYGGRSPQNPLNAVELERITTWYA